MTPVIGIDIGGSSITAVSYDDSGDIVERHEVDTRPGQSSDITRSAVAAATAVGLEHCTAVGVGIPGQVDVQSGQVTMAVNLGIGSDPYDLAAEIEDAIGLPVSIENDVRAAALGAYETAHRAGSRPVSLTLLNIGTGISAGVVVDGTILRGSHGMAGEIGHVVVEDDGPPCRCGQHGCLEVFAAGPGIARTWPSSESPGELFARAVAGDPEASPIAERIANHLVTALIWMAAAHDTEAFVLAGGVAIGDEGFIEMIRRQIQRRAAGSELAARRLRPDQVTLASVDDPPGPRGSATLAAGLIRQRRASPAGKQATNES